MVEIRVHVLIDSLNWGGAEGLLADLAVGAPAAGIALSVGYLQDVNGSPAAARLRARGIEPELVGVRRLLDVKAVRDVRRQLARVRPDIVHTQLDAADTQGTLAARSLGLPAVSTVHLIGRHAGRDDARDVVKEHLAALVRRRGSARVITVSDAARTAYLAAYRERPERVVTVHNGIAHRPPRRPPAEVRAALGLEPDALVAAIVAVLRPGKGHDVAVEAIRRLTPRFPRLRLLVIGSGPSLEEVRGLVAPLGEAALLLGHRDDVPELLSATDVLLHPTSADAFPTVLLEAGASGLPTIATAVGGIPEILDDGVTGILVDAPPHADAVTAALERLLADDALRARLGAAARTRFDAEFTAAHWAEHLRGVYDAVLAERRPRRR